MAEEERRREGLLADLSKANEQATAATAATEQVSAKLATALERHAADLAELQAELTASEAKAHELELQLARAEAKPNKPAAGPESQKLRWLHVLPDNDGKWDCRQGERALK